MGRWIGNPARVGTRRCAARGYTLGEVVVVIAILGILSAVVVPVYSGLRRSSLEMAAMHHARMINAARESFALTVPSASARWTEAADTEARLRLLIDEQLLGGEVADYLNMSGKYAVELNGPLRARTVLTCAGGAVDY